MTADEPDWLDDDEQIAWRGIIESSRRIIDRIETDLRADSDLTLDDYEVLAKLSEAPERRRRMTELARIVISSPSRLSQRIDRMAEAGLVRRERSERDRRGWYAVLTEAGFERLVDAVPAHVDSVRRHVISNLERADLLELGRIMPQLADALRDDPELTEPKQPLPPAR